MTAQSAEILLRRGTKEISTDNEIPTEQDSDSNTLKEKRGVIFSHDPRLTGTDIVICECFCIIFLRNLILLNRFRLVLSQQFNTNLCQFILEEQVDQFIDRLECPVLLVSPSNEGK